MEYVLIILICMLGGISAGLTGFGYAISCMVFLPLFIDIKSSTLVVTISAFVSYFIILYKTLIKSKIKLKINMIVVPLIAMIVGANIGVYLLQILPETILVGMLCIYLVILNLYYLFMAKRVQIKPTKKTALVAGFIGGIFGGLYNISGPTIAAYYFAVEEENLKYSAYLQVVFLIGAIYAVLLHFSIGNITSTILTYSGMAIVGITFGTLIGFKLFVKINRDRLRKYISILILLSSMLLIIKTVSEMI